MGLVYDMLSLAVTNAHTVHPTPVIMAAIGPDMLGLCGNTHTRTDTHVHPQTHSSTMDACERVKNQLLSLFFSLKEEIRSWREFLHYPCNYLTCPLLFAWAGLAVGTET